MKCSVEHESFVFASTSGLCLRETLLGLRLPLDDSYNQQVKRPHISQIPLPEEPYKLGNETETMTD